VILNQRRDIECEIKKLLSFKIPLTESQYVYVKFRIYLTAIDGKELNALTDTKSFQQCPICQSNQKDFLGIKNFKCFKFLPIMHNFKYGVSPFHCWLHFFEFVLHAVYKMGIKKWRIANPSEKKAMLERKSNIQQDFWDKLSLKVDYPKQGGFGNTNMGNTASHAFANVETFSEITGFDQQIIYNLRIILQCLSSQLPINLGKFETCCHQTGE